MIAGASERIAGRCHCGNIAFDFTRAPASADIVARACTCSFCTRHNGVWTSSPAGSLTVTIDDASLHSIYAFGTRTAEFHVCARCGVVTVVTSRIDGNVYAVVNVNAFDGVDPSRLRPASMTFDDEADTARLARRKRNWIATVRQVGGQQR